ncbi:MAG: urease accessory protein UreF [Betaproteobacteria bacterium]|nr:urease accessory protein UreF [Betaproteobacteria bacterium]
MSLALARLLQLASPALPVGAFSYSQGLEWAIEEGTVRDEASSLVWIGDLLEHNHGRFEAPLLARLIDAWSREDLDAIRELNGFYLASRESAELRAETLQMGYSLVRLLRELGDFPANKLAALDVHGEASFPAAWSAAAAAWNIPPEDALTVWLWTWSENLVMAALKAVPLGQSAGQRILLALGARLPAIAQSALALEPETWSNLAPGFAIASCRHETQYSRLFRS